MKIPVGILGATGAVGQKFIELLTNHPWFEVTALAASIRSQGKSYAEAVNWFMGSHLDERIGNLKVLPCEPQYLPKFVFSALDADAAGEIEQTFLDRGHTLISNARNFRLLPNIPLLVPEVNPEQLDWLKNQTNGKMLTVPNCSTIGLTLALKPLHDLFHIEKLHVVTLQAISGAGYPGVASLDITDNVIPFISGEESKMEIETCKILGSDIKISAHCNRVHVSDGHTECVSLSFKHKPSEKELMHAWQNFSALPQSLNLPLAPLKPIHYHMEDKFPQPKPLRLRDKGMAVHIGRLRPCPLFDYKFTLMSHNTIRGAAGGGILIGELMHAQGLNHF